MSVSACGVRYPGCQVASASPVEAYKLILSEISTRCMCCKLHVAHYMSVSVLSHAGIVSMLLMNDKPYFVAKLSPVWLECLR